MEKRKAQMKMGETIMVLVVFFILVMVGLAVYSGYRQRQIEDKAEERDRLKSIEIATMLTELPEMQCSEFMCINCDNAIDLLKLRAISEECEVCDLPGDCDPCDYDYQDPTDSIIRANPVFYADMFSTTTVKVHVIPSPSYEISEVEDYTVYDAKGRKETVLSPYFIPVNVYDAFTDECRMGIVEIMTWS